MTIALAAVCALLHLGYGVAEVALGNASLPALEREAAAGDRAAARAVAFARDEQRLLATALVGTSLFGALGIALAGPWAPLYVVALALGDAALPRALGHELALALAVPASRGLAATETLLWPFVVVIAAWARRVASLAGSTRSGLTRQEIVLRLGTDSGIDPQEQAMLRRVFALPDTPAQACMTPMSAVDGVRSEESVAAASAAITRTGHTRLVVYEGDNSVIGVAHARDLFAARVVDRPVRTAMRSIRRVPADRRVPELIQEMRRLREVIVLLVDADQRAIGIVTIEDLIEEIVGEIHDERDRTAPPAPRRTTAGVGER